MAVQTVFLDAGGVLVYPNWARVSGALEQHGVSASAGDLAAVEPRVKRQLDVGRTVQASNDTTRGWLYFNLVLEAAGIARSARTDAALRDLHAYHMTSNLWEHVPEHVTAVLETLNAAGLRLVVVSNANGTLREHFRRIGLDRHFACVLDSCDEGVEKPDPRLFTLALERAGADAATTIHVGDFYEIDVVGARAAGIRGVLLDEAGLYPEADCPRLRTLAELPGRISAGDFG